MNHASTPAKLKLGTRLTLGFGVLIVLMIALTVLGISRVSSINRLTRSPKWKVRLMEKPPSAGSRIGIHS